MERRKHIIFNHVQFLKIRKDYNLKLNISCSCFADISVECLLSAVFGSRDVQMLQIIIFGEARLTPDEHFPDFNSLLYMPALRNCLFNLL